jgi:glutathione/glutaredoxin type arsenate reductase
MEKVLFVCVHNSCRSQMAEGFANHLGKDVLKAYSAGSAPSGLVDLTAIKVMKEAGIDIASQSSKGFSDLGAMEFDRVITMGCKDTCPIAPAKHHADWHIEDPKGKDIKLYRKIRDEIEYNVLKLVRELSLKTEDFGGR